LRKKKIILIAIIALVISLSGISYIYMDKIVDLYDYSKVALSSYGSTGQEVIDIQSKLYNWGYYDGPVDGDYGYKTFEAVRSFQIKNGLAAVDGIAGSETLAALGLPTSAGASASGAASGSSSQVNLLAHLIYGEARGEPYTGQVAVGAVILNRTRDSRFPKTIAGVVYQPGAFDAVSDGQIYLDPDGGSYKAAKDALNGWDPTGGCIYYWNPATATSTWIWSRPVITQIGRHVFAK
jgi:N-acetylmuramoyl-L-alanine amidase